MKKVTRVPVLIVTQQTMHVHSHISTFTAIPVSRMYPCLPKRRLSYLHIPHCIPSHFTVRMQRAIHDFWHLHTCVYMVHAHTYSRCAEWLRDILRFRPFLGSIHTCGRNRVEIRKHGHRASVTSVTHRHAICAARAGGWQVDKNSASFPAQPKKRTSACNPTHSQTSTHT